MEMYMHGVLQTMIEFNVLIKNFKPLITPNN